MILREFIQRIQSLYSKGVQSDDTALSSRHIYNKLLTVWGKLLVQEANKKKKLSQWNFQTLNCVELIKAPAHECPCLPPAGCEILRTKYRIPKPLTDINKHLIQSVTTIDGGVIFSEMGWEEKKYRKGSKYTSHKPDYFLRDGYIYVTHEIGLKVISVTGIFENPLKAYSYPTLCGDCETCQCDSPLDMEFPAEPGMCDTIIEMASLELIDKFMQMQQDLTNNTLDNTAETSK